MNNRDELAQVIANAQNVPFVGKKQQYIADAILAAGWMAPQEAGDRDEYQEALASWEFVKEDAEADVINHPLSLDLLKAWYAAGFENGAQTPVAAPICDPEPDYRKVNIAEVRDALHWLRGTPKFSGICGVIERLWREALDARHIAARYPNTTESNQP